MFYIYIFLHCTLIVQKIKIISIERIYLFLNFYSYFILIISIDVIYLKII